MSEPALSSLPVVCFVLVSSLVSSGAFSLILIILGSSLFIISRVDETLSVKTI